MYYNCYLVCQALFKDGRRGLILRSFTRIKRLNSLVEEVMNKLKKAIIAGHYSAGEALPGKTQPASQMAVS